MVLHDLLPLQPIVIVSTKSVPVVLGVDGTTCDCITDPIAVYSAQHIISNMVTSLARGKLVPLVKITAQNVSVRTIR